MHWTGCQRPWLIILHIAFVLNLLLLAQTGYLICSPWWIMYEEERINVKNCFNALLPPTQPSCPHFDKWVRSRVHCPLVTHISNHTIHTILQEQLQNGDNRNFLLVKCSSMLDFLRYVLDWSLKCIVEKIMITENIEDSMKLSWVKVGDCQVWRPPSSPFE